MIKSFIPVCVLFLASLTLAACSDDDNDNETLLDITTFQAGGIVVSDVGDLGNPNDIAITFQAPSSALSITEYRIFFGALESNFDLSGESFKSLSDNYFTSITGITEGEEFRLDSEQLSIDNETMIEGQDYQVYILSIGDFNQREVLAVSEPSSSFQLVDNTIFDILDYTTNISSVVDDDNDGDASDLLVSFSTGRSNALITEYRLMILKSSQADDFDLAGAQLVEENNYASITGVSDDDATYSFNPDANLKDVNGNEILQNEPYIAFILSVGTFKGEEVMALSSPSSMFALVIKPEVYTLVENLGANDAISVDSEGNIYVSEYGVFNNANGKGTGTKVLKITASGNVSEFVSDLSGPVGNAIDDDGNFYVNNDNDFVMGELLKVSPTGEKSIIANIEGYAGGVLLGIDDNFYISNYSAPIVSKVTPDGTVTDFADDDRLTGGVGIAYDDDGNIIVGNFITGDILSIDLSGSVSLIATLPTVQSRVVIGYLTYFEGFIYATGNGARKVYRVSLQGNVVEFAGNGTSALKDDEFDKASFLQPNGIAVDKNKKLLYITDSKGDGTAALRVIPLD